MNAPSLLRRARLSSGRVFLPLLTALALLVPALHAQVPGILSYQGRITTDGAPFNGNGQFKFALVTAGGGTSLWSNDNTSTTGNEPVAAVTLPVAGGLYSVLLGDTAIPNMTKAIPGRVFAENEDVRVRVWFNDGSNGFQLLAPDQRIAAVGYALNAAGAVFSGAQEFKTAGSSTFTVPAGVTKILVEVWGAGGGTTSTSHGGSGAYSRKTFAVTPGDQWTVVVGAPGVNGNPGTNGGNSSVSSLTVPGSSLVSQGGNAPVSSGGPTTTITAALPDAAADIGRSGPVFPTSSTFVSLYVTGTVAPPNTFIPATPPSSGGTQAFSSVGAAAGGGPTGPAIPAQPGYVLIQW